ncbi:MAG: energy transducer TonB [candidate division WOR-3 bacterium]|uniref:Energy transducer TonB n=1 Tax=candidate division WOR-3 bacterium TaxID=2052148 RepID=A0A7V3ZTC5_UNCW3
MKTTTTKVYSLVYRTPRKNDFFGIIGSIVLHIIIFLLLLLRQERIETGSSLSVTLLEEERKKEKKVESLEKKEPEAPKQQVKVTPNLMYALRQMAPTPPPPIPAVYQKFEIQKVERLPQEPGVVPPIGGIEIKEITEAPGPQARLDISKIELAEGGFGGEIVVGRGVPTSEILKAPVHTSAISIGEVAPEATGSTWGGGLLEPGGGAGGRKGIDIGVKIEERAPPPPAVSTPSVKITTTPTIEKKEKKVTFEISGSIAGRKILYGPLPSYPSWAAERGLEAVIVLRVYVTPEGNVKSNLVVFHTSGYPEWDELVKRILLSWRFEPLPEGSDVIQSGYITFRFILE